MRNIFCFIICVGALFNGCNSKNKGASKELDTHSIIYKNIAYKKFSNNQCKDRFELYISGENILEGLLIFRILNCNGKEIFFEKHKSYALVNQYKLDENTPKNVIEEYIKTRFLNFFEEENFYYPAINKTEYFDSDYSDLEIWQEIKSDSTAIGFYYMTWLENGCRIAFSKKNKSVVKYFCCC